MKELNHVAIPSKRGCLSDRKTMENINNTTNKSQSPRSGAVFPTNSTVEEVEEEKKEVAIPSKRGCLSDWLIPPK